MFAGICFGAILATALYTFTIHEIYIILIPIGLLVGVGIGATRCPMEGHR